MKVEVYYNLHKECLSVRSKGKVIAHKDSVNIIDPKFVVQPAGRARVLSEHRKNVHAFVRGEKSGFCISEQNFKRIQIVYNPYKYETFVNRKTKKPIYQAKYARVEGKNIIAWI